MRAALVSPATSVNSGASCVQATVSGRRRRRAARKRSSSARQSWRPVDHLGAAAGTRAPRRRRAAWCPRRNRSGFCAAVRPSLIILCRRRRVGTAASRRIFTRSGRGTGLGTLRAYNYSDSKKKGRELMPLETRAPIRSAAPELTLPPLFTAGAPARAGRRLRACAGDRGRKRRRHAGLCRALRSRRIRAGAGAGRAAAQRAARLLCRHGGARRRARPPAPPPETAISIEWPDALTSNYGLVGGGRLAWPTRRREDEAPPWLVFGGMIRTVSMTGSEPGAAPARHRARGGRLRRHAGADELVESFARHFMVAIDAWQESGFGAVAQRLSAAARRRRRACAATSTTTAICCVRRVGTGKAERKQLAAGARRAVMARSR